MGNIFNKNEYDIFKSIVKKADFSIIIYFLDLLGELNTSNKYNLINKIKSKINNEHYIENIIMVETDHHESYFKHKLSFFEFKMLFKYKNLINNYSVLYTIIHQTIILTNDINQKYNIDYNSKV